MLKTSKEKNDLENYEPESWSDIIGNHKLKEYWSDLLWCVRQRGDRSGFNTMITGPSRGGKTSTIQFGIKALLCCNLDLTSMNPCHRCANCTMNSPRFSNEGWNP